MDVPNTLEIQNAARDALYVQLSYNAAHSFHGDEFALQDTLRIFPTEMVATAEAAERDLASRGLRFETGAEFSLEEILHREIDRLRLHLACEKTSMDIAPVATVHEIPPGDGIHLLHREPRTIAVAGHYSIFAAPRENSLQR